MLQTKERHGGNSHKLVLTTTVNEILPYDKSESVTVIIPTKRLELDMLSYHIEAHILEHLQLIKYCLVTRVSKQAVAPISLIQKAVEEVRLSVEKQAGNSVLILTDSKRTNAKVRSDLITAVRRYLEIIQLGIFGRPNFKVIFYLY